MICKTVTTQAELNEALADNSIECVHIKSERGVWLELGNHSKSVEASGSASVRAYDSASVSAFGSASVSAFGSASVSAYDSASVSAFGSASVRAFGSASVRAYDSASVRAYDSASVSAFGSASVSAYDSASVSAYDSASVRAYDSASVSAYDSASVSASGATRVSVHGSGRIAAGPNVAVHLHSGRAQVTGGILIDLSSLDLTDAATWCEHEGVDVVDGQAVLYKAVDDELQTGHEHDRVTTYTIGAQLVCADWRDNHLCGGGLHLSPTPHQATHYRENATRWLRCTADLADVRPIPGDVAKCKVRAVRVEAEVDIHGRPVAREAVAAA